VKRQKFLSHLQQPKVKQLRRRASALRLFQFQFFKRRKLQMLQQKHHVVQKLKVAMRKLPQKIPHQQVTRQVMRAIQIHATEIVDVDVADVVVVAHKVKVLKDQM
jgi:hypothetical protein